MLDKCDNGVITLVNENSSIYNQSPIHELKSLTFDVVEEFATFYVDWNDTGIFTSGTYESGQFFSIMSDRSYTCTFEDEYPDYFRIRTIGDSISITSVAITYTCK